MLGKHISVCEDSLTASVITHLLHLPCELFWRILRNACYTENLPEYPGEPLEVIPWPKWNAKGSKNTNYVEPDVFIRFPEFDLIFEAKRWDDGMQNPDQWWRELIGYLNEYGEERQQVRLIALGGILGTSDMMLTVPASGERQETHCPVHMCKWERVMAECQRMLKEISLQKYPSSQSKSHERILSDLINLFGWHEFQTGIWFGDVARDFPQLSSWALGHHIKTFRQYYPTTYTYECAPT